MEEQELFAMQCNICRYVTTLLEAEYQYMQYCGKCKNPFDSGRWKSIYKTNSRSQNL